MILKFLNVPIFLLSLAMGLFFVYIYGPDPRTIFVYPTPNNTDVIQYRDKLGNCFYYKQERVKCSSKDTLKQVPAQT